ncbi:hypothetical protein WJX84_004449 [Apatococcus fuscideae]
MIAADMRNFGTVVNQILTVITAGLRKGPEVVIATLAAIRQLAMSMLRGPSPWKSAGLLVKAVLHVMRQRQIRPDVAEAAVQCWRGLLEDAVAAPEGRQYTATVAAVLEPVLCAYSTTNDQDSLANSSRLPEV